MKKKTEPLRGVCKDCARAPKCREKNPVDDQGRKLRTIYCNNFRGPITDTGRMLHAIFNEHPELVKDNVDPTSFVDPYFTKEGDPE